MALDYKRPLCERRGLTDTTNFTNVNNMKITSVALTQDHVNALRVYQQHGISVSYVVRAALDQYFPRHTKAMQRMMQKKGDSYDQNTARHAAHRSVHDS